MMMMSYLKKPISEGLLRSKSSRCCGSGCRMEDTTIRCFTSTPANNDGATTTATSTREQQHQRLVDSTRMWFQKVVVGHKLCPFAKLSATRIVASLAETKDMALLDVRTEIDQLMRADRVTTHETTLLVFDKNVYFTKRLLNFAELVEDSHETIVIPEGYDDQLQLVLFHPLFRHLFVPNDESPNETAADYSMRSPYPTIHLLREVDVRKTADSGLNVDELPVRNEKRLLSLGLGYCRSMLNACYQPPDK